MTLFEIFQQGKDAALFDDVERPSIIRVLHQDGSYSRIQGEGVIELESDTYCFYGSELVCAAWIPFEPGDSVKWSLRIAIRKNEEMIESCQDRVANLQKQLDRPPKKTLPPEPVPAPRPKGAEKE